MPEPWENALPFIAAAAEAAALSRALDLPDGPCEPWWPGYGPPTPPGGQLLVMRRRWLDTVQAEERRRDAARFRAWREEREREAERVREAEEQAAREREAERRRQQERERIEALRRSIKMQRVSPRDREILQAVAAGEAMAFVAKRYGMSRGRVSFITRALNATSPRSTSLATTQAPPSSITKGAAV